MLATGPDLRLRQRREALGYSVHALAGVLGVAPSTVYRWESGDMPVEKPRLVGWALRGLELEAGTGRSRPSRRRP